MRISNCTQKEASYRSAQIQASHLPGSSLPDQFRAAKSCVQMKILIQVRPLCVPHTPRHRRQAHGSMQVRPQIQAAGCQSALQAGHHASRLWATMLMPGIWARRLRDLRPGDGLGAGGHAAAPVVHLLTLAIRMSREEPRRRSPRFGDGLGAGGREAAHARLLALAARASAGGRSGAVPVSPAAGLARENRMRPPRPPADACHQDVAGGTEAAQSPSRRRRAWRGRPRGRPHPPAGACRQAVGTRAPPPAAPVRRPFRSPTPRWVGRPGACGPRTPCRPRPPQRRRRGRGSRASAPRGPRRSRTRCRSG